MEVFELIVDEKVSVWRRSRVKIIAELLEDAVKDCVENGIGNAIDITDSEYLYETEDYIQPDEYLNPITVEVMDNQYKTLATDEKR